MYVLAANATTIDVLALNAPGKAQTIQKLAVAATAQKANLKLSQYNPSKPSPSLILTGARLLIQVLSTCKA